MTFKKTLAVTTAAAVMASGAMAQDVAIILGSQQDSFWNVVKKGAEDAALAIEARGGSVNILQVPNYDNYGADLATLIEQATAQGVDGIATVLPDPNAQIPAIKAAQEAGIPVTTLNGGGDFLEEAGALNYFGSDEYVAGVAGGKFMAEAGATKVLCHIQIPGTVNLEARCKGVEDGATEAGIEAVILRVPANLDGDMAGTAAAIEAELNGDPSIDGVVNLATWAADASANAIEQLGKTGEIKLGTFDLSPAVLDRIAAGTQTMAIDQQPYLQGYLSVSMIGAHAAFGSEIATKPVLTGPAIVSSANIDSVLAGVKAGAR